MAKQKEKKYKAFNITKAEYEAIESRMEQIRHDSESADEEYAQWASEQITLISSFLRKVKPQ
ncbi:hypothetical protein [Sphingobacterium sp.]|uniref:hypothetical protein n=1 Tax=Sphingobacterium sp. TaxID=341027 RepID=UPI002FDE3EB5